jgi:hypothetical protein
MVGKVYEALQETAGPAPKVAAPAPATKPAAPAKDPKKKNR